MTNDELKKKIIEILEETEYEWTEDKNGYILQIFYDKYDICARDSEDGRMSCKYFKRTFLKRPTQSYCFVETDEK